MTRREGERRESVFFFFPMCVPFLLWRKKKKRRVLRRGYLMQHPPPPQVSFLFLILIFVLFFSFLFLDGEDQAAIASFPTLKQPKQLLYHKINLSITECALDDVLINSEFIFFSSSHNSSFLVVFSLLHHSIPATAAPLIRESEVPLGITVVVIIILFHFLVEGGGAGFLVESFIFFFSHLLSSIMINTRTRTGKNRKKGHRSPPSPPQKKERKGRRIEEGESFKSRLSRRPCRCVRRASLGVVPDEKSDDGCGVRGGAREAKGVGRGTFSTLHLSLLVSFNAPRTRLNARLSKQIFAFLSLSTTPPVCLSCLSLFTLLDFTSLVFCFCFFYLTYLANARPARNAKMAAGRDKTTKKKHCGGWRSGSSIRKKNGRKNTRG